MFQTVLIKESRMDIKNFANADIDRVFDALHFDIFFVQMWYMYLKIIEKYRVFKLQKRCKNFLTGVWFLAFPPSQNRSGKICLVQNL